MDSTKPVGKIQSLKWCFVPLCKSTVKLNPEKLFFHVPKDPPTRRAWFKAARRVMDVSYKCTLYCCEDHFNADEDADNLLRHRMMGGPLKLKRGVVPHIFSCQKDRNKRAGPTKERPYFVKRKRLEIITEVLAEGEQSCNFDNTSDPDESPDGNPAPVSNLEPYTHRKSKTDEVTSLFHEVKKERKTSSSDSEGSSESESVSSLPPAPKITPVISLPPFLQRDQNEPAAHSQPHSCQNSDPEHYHHLQPNVLHSKPSCDSPPIAFPRDSCLSSSQSSHPSAQPILSHFSDSLAMHHLEACDPTFDKINSPSASHHNSTQRHPGPNCPCSEVLLKKLSILEQQNQVLNSKLDLVLNLLQCGGSETENVVPNIAEPPLPSFEQLPLDSTLPLNLPVSLPLTGVAALEHLERELDQESTFQQVMNHLSSIGGKDRKKTVRNILKAVISKELVSKLNWVGRGSKTGFSQYQQLLLCLFCAAKRNPFCLDLTKSDMNEIIKTFLR